MERKKIQSFTDLEAWKEAHKLVLMVYKATEDYPKAEMFGLINHTQKSSVSVSSNIAEGFSRISFKDKMQFYNITLGSTTELQNQLLIARDLNYLPKDQFMELANQTVKVHKLTNGLIKSCKSRLRTPDT